MFKALKSGLDSLKKRAEAFLQSKVASSNEAYKEELASYIQPLSMMSYAVSLAIVEAEKSEIEKAKGKGRAKKDKSSAEGWAPGSTFKDKMLTTILNFLELDLARFWSLSQPVAEFCQLWTNVAAVMMENPANVKSAGLRNNLVLLFAKLVQKYDQHISVAHKISHQIHSHAHVAKPYATMLQDIAQKYENTKFVSDIVRDIGNEDVASLSKDTTAAKNVSAFLVNMAGALPKVVLQNVSMFMTHLDADFYVIRNGVIEMLGELVLKAFDSSDAKDDSEQTRNKLLECLQERFLDNNAFCRGRTMDTWSALVENRVVPMKFMNEITSLTMRRLNDKGAVVRKQAIRLLTTILKHNAFCPTLRVSELKARLAIVSDRLKEQYAKIKSNNGGAEGGEGAASAEVDKENAASDAAASARAAELQAKAVENDLLEYGFLNQTVEFAETMDRATVTMCKMLGSKNKSDLVEIIRFFATAKEYHLESAEEGFRKMLVLLWSDEKAIRDDVVTAYKERYLTVAVPKNEPNPQRYACFRVAFNLIALTEGATLSQLTSLELLMTELLKADMLHAGVIDALWNIFAGAVEGNRVQDSRGAIALLSMIAAERPDTVRDHIDKLARVGLMDHQRWMMDPTFARHVAITLQRLGGPSQVKFPADHPLFEKITELLLLSAGLASNWCQSAEHLIDAVYTLCDEPHGVMEPIIKTLANYVFTQPQPCVDRLARLLFLVGHVALKELLQVEAIKQQQKAKKKDEKKASPQGKTPGKDNLEDELGVDEQNQAMEEEFLNSVSDKFIVCQNLLGYFGPIMQRILLNDKNRYSHRILQAVASLSLAKFMAVSQTFCKNNLQLLFTVLEKQKDEAIRSNIIIALGDLSYRFPNLVEPWSPSIYARLQDESSVVRKTAIMVLSHLILNGVIKIKNNGGLLALAVIDGNPRISEFSRQFFIKLSQTDKGIYNALPDIVSFLSTSPQRLDDAAFKQIVTFIFGFIQTEKETESLIERFCQRLAGTSVLQHQRDFALCMSLLTFNERAMKKLLSCAPQFKDLCQDESIYLSFQEMVNKAKKVNKSCQAAQEVQKIMDECFMKHNPNKTLPSGEAPAKRVKATATKKGGANSKSKRKRAGKMQDYDDDDDDEDDDVGDSSELEEEEEEAPPGPSQPQQDNVKKTTSSSSSSSAPQSSIAVPTSVQLADDNDHEDSPVRKAPQKKRIPAKPKAAAPPKQKRTGRAAPARKKKNYDEDEDDEDEEDDVFSDDE